MDKVKVGLIGLGWMGQLHLRYLSETESCSIEAVCDVDEKKAQETAEKYGARATEITWAVYEALRTGNIVKVNYGTGE